MSASETEKTEETLLIGKAPQPSEERIHHVTEENLSFWNSGRAPMVLCILFTELCERLTYYSISANLVLFCTSILGIDSATAVTITLAFTGTSYFLPIIGGYIADTVAGKFNTIYGSALIYIIGTTLLPIISWDYKGSGLYFADTAKQVYFGLALFLVAVGTGGIKSNVGPFGAQQLEDLGEGAIRSFFNWFYWFINVGSAVSFSVVVYIQQSISFFWGFLIPAVSMLLANLLFLLQRSKYINQPPEGSALTNIVKITARTCGVCCKKPEPDEGMHIQSRFDYAKQSNGGKYSDVDVECTKSILRILPIFGTFILYWTIYTQMSSTYFLQGERLDLKLKSFTLPVAILNMFDIIVILVLVPLFDRILYPGLQELGINFSLLRRIGTGMVLAASSVIIAAIVEIERKKGMRDGNYISQNLSTETFNASTISVFVQIPQFALIGASEVFTSITGLEFAYSQSPVALQGVVMGLFLLTTGLGSYVGSLLVLAVNAISSGKGNTWLPDEINDGHLEYFFFLLAGLMVINFFIYLWIASGYEYVKPSSYFEFTAGENSGDDSRHGNSPRKRNRPRPPSKAEIQSESEI